MFEQTQFFNWHHPCSSLPLPPPGPRPPPGLSLPSTSAPAKSSSLGGRKRESGSGWSRKGQGQERALLVSPVPHPRVRGLAGQEAACDTSAPPQASHPRGRRALVPRAQPPSLTEASGVGAGRIKALDAAPLTEGVLRLVGVEGVCGDALGSLRDTDKALQSSFTKTSRAKGSVGKPSRQAPGVTSNLRLGPHVHGPETRQPAV